MLHWPLCHKCIFSPETSFYKLPLFTHKHISHCMHCLICPSVAGGSNSCYVKQAI
eukprot:c41075_g1_i1 orf=3-164(-)